MDDDLGHQLCESRLNLALELLEEGLHRGFPEKKFLRAKRWVITGIGSSEAHAKYLEFLINKHTSYVTKFIHIMDFYDEDFKPKGTLIVYS